MEVFNHLKEIICLGFSSIFLLILGLDWLHNYDGKLEKFMTILDLVAALVIIVYIYFVRL